MFETFDKTEVLKPMSLESALGKPIEMTETTELGGYRVGDVIQFKRVNALPFGQADIFEYVEDKYLELEIIGVSLEGKLIVRWTAAEAFIEQCTVEQLNASRI